MMPARIERRLKRLLLAYLLVAWGASWAALETGPNLVSLPWAQALVGVGVAWIGGFAATLGRIVAAMYDDKPFHKPYELARDGSVSAVIGLGGYLGGMANETSPALLALVLLVSGYAGTRTLSVWVDRLIKPAEPQ